MYLAGWRVVAEQLPSCRTELTTVFKAWLDAPANRPVDIWPAREPDAKLLAGARPVAVVVWESGFETTFFPSRRRSTRPSHSMGRTMTAMASLTTFTVRPSTLTCVLAQTNCRPCRRFSRAGSACRWRLNRGSLTSTSETIRLMPASSQPGHATPALPSRQRICSDRANSSPIRMRPKSRASSPTVHLSYSCTISSPTPKVPIRNLFRSSRTMPRAGSRCCQNLPLGCALQTSVWST